MRIGELSRATGASPRSLRYYEEQGLLRPRRDDSGYGHRRYDADAVDTVHAIRALLAAGVPTGLIYDLLPCAQGRDRSWSVAPSRWCGSSSPGSTLRSRR